MSSQIMSPRILTIGHSNHSVEHFVELLRGHEVRAVADVRSAPFSRYTPQFNKPSLKETLDRADVGYVFLGKELGARTSDRSCYVDGKVQYALLARTDAFEAGIERLLRGAEERQVAVMCTEKDPLDCHRTVLIARALVSARATVDHILSDGRLESNDQAMIRLVEKQGLGQPDLFRSSEEVLEEALHRQEQAIAYVERDEAQSTAERSA